MKEESDNASEGKCPFGFSDKNQVPNTGFSNSKWWPNQLNLKILHQNSALTNPMSNDFNYKDEFNSLDFLLFKQNIEKSIFSFSNLKTLYFFPSGRWDILTDKDILIKLPKEHIVASLNLSKKLIDNDNFKDNKFIDLRVKNNLVTK